MGFEPDAMIGLQYIGKKVPFEFVNDKMKCGRLRWEKRGDVVECEYADAQVLIVGSGNDFFIVTEDLNTKEDPVVLEPSDDVDITLQPPEIKEVPRRKPGRPKKVNAEA